MHKRPFPIVLMMPMLISVVQMDFSTGVPYAVGSISKSGVINRVGIQGSSNRALYSVDSNNGNTTFVDGLRSTIIPAVSRFAVDPATNTFYSTDNSFPLQLSHFDANSSLSLTLFNFVEGNFSIIDLEWNLTNNSLYGLSKSSNRLFQFTDLATATGVFVGASIGTGSYNSLVYSQANNVFITIENETSLIEIDATTGIAATQGTVLTGNLRNAHSIAYIP